MNNATNIIKTILFGTVVASFATANGFGGDLVSDPQQPKDTGTNSPPGLTLANDPMLSQAPAASAKIIPGATLLTNEFGGSIRNPMVRPQHPPMHATPPLEQASPQGSISAVPAQAQGVSSSRAKMAAETEVARERMISEQLVARGIANQTVLAAMRNVPRILPYEVASDTFEDKPVDIRYGRTVESPYVVASVAEQFNPNPRSTDRVLEIGTGSGYQTAVLSLVVKEVYSVEINANLARRAQADLKNTGYTNNVFLRAGEVAKGWPEAAPFDAVVVNGALDVASETIISQLKEGGRLIIPVDQNGNLDVLQKSSGQLVALASRRVRLPQTPSNKTTLPSLPMMMATPQQR
jgi:protein-L-isoaspartate(D-aspartate) O-methyltransferase